MKGKIYRVRAFAGVLEWTHGIASKITEVYLPELGIAFNDMNETAFRTDASRYENDAEQVGEVWITPEDVKVLKEMVRGKEKMKKIVEHYMAKREVTPAMENGWLCIECSEWNSEKLIRCVRCGAPKFEKVCNKKVVR